MQEEGEVELLGVPIYSDLMTCPHGNFLHGVFLKDPMAFADLIFVKGRDTGAWPLIISMWNGLTQSGLCLM